MQSWMERSSPNLVPIKSSLSFILSDVWSNTVCHSADWLGNAVEDADKLDVFAQKLAARKQDAPECEKKAKKSRQVFTCSQPPQAGIVADFTGKDIEVYESVGGQDLGLFCGMEPHLDTAPKQVRQPCITVPDVTPQALESDRSMHQSTRGFASEISHPKLTLPQARSECELKTCFPSPAKPSLFYTVSDSSLPILQRSSRILSRLSSQMPVLLDAGLKEELVIPPTIPMYGIRSSCFSYDLLGRSILFNPHCKDILIKCKNMDGALARKIAQTIQTVKKRRGKFMSYAKFNSSFKLSEVFYEDINSKRLSHVPSFRLSELIHKVNPDYDENMSEAMTLMSLSPITSMSRITTMRRWASSANSITTGPFSCDWANSNSSCNTDPKPTKRVDFDTTHVEDSPFTVNSGVSLAHVVTTARKQQLSTLQDSVRSALQGGQKETDIWSSSAKSQEIKATPKRWVDLSPSCIFLASVTDRKKLPVWKLKPDKPGMNYRTDLINDFIFKAHNYMHVRSRPNSHRCFFHQPTYRAVDEGVQFPDVALTWDRSSNVKEPLIDNHIPANKNSDDQSGRSTTKCKVDPESSIPSEVTPSVDDVPPVNPNLKNLKVVVACDKPFYSTSEFQTVSTDPVAVPKTESSSMNLPASTSSNKCRFSSSEYHTISAASLQPRNRKLAGKLPPVAENPKCCRNRRLPESSRFCHSFRAVCDKRKIKIKYENGRFTVLKEKGRPKRQTVWSIITGKATHLLDSVLRRKPHVRQASRR